MNTDFQYKRHHVSLQKTIYGNYRREGFISK
jgi:hypothetical protein